MKINKEMMIKEIFLKFPEKSQELANYLFSHGVRCISCCSSAWESLEEGLRSHGKSDEQIDEIVKSLNTIVDKI